MSHLYYRLSETTDPEERLEDAALYKALHDVYGGGLTLVPNDAPSPEDGLFLGRGKKSEYNSKNLLGEPGMPYWEDPAFQGGINRSFIVTDLNGAQMEVERLHAEGKDAFLKSTRQKHFVRRIDQDQSFSEGMNGMEFSFMDRENCLMVQEAVEMKYERRFLVMNGKVVTHSPVAWHLTPMSRSSIKDETGLSTEDLHYATPRDHTARFSPTATARMLAVAQSVADASDNPHLCIDLAIIGDDIENDPIEVIEFNPMQPGAVGLYACDPSKIAEAVWDAMDPELQMMVQQRRDGLIPAGFEDPASAKMSPAEMATNVHPVVQNMLGGEETLSRAFSKLHEDAEAMRGTLDERIDAHVDERENMKEPAGKMITRDVIRAARNMRSVTPLLIADDLYLEQDRKTARQGILDLMMMIDLALRDRGYRENLQAWLGGETSTIELRELFAGALNDGKTYWNDEDVAHRIDILDSASLHVKDHVFEISYMEDIRQLAIEFGARFSVIKEDKDLSKSYAWCGGEQDNMDLSALRRLDEALADRREDEEVEWDDDAEWSDGIDM